MKKLCFYSLLLSLFQYQCFSQTSVSGTLSSDSEWTSVNSPYILTSTVGIAPGTTLTIQNGVQIQGNFDLLIKGRIVANGVENDSIDISNTRIIFKSASLGNSELSYLSFSNGGGVQLADESEFNQDSPKNSGVLTVSHSGFRESSFAHTKGYDSGSKLVLENCSFYESTIKGYYPRSEVIECMNCEIRSSTINSDSYNHGIFLTSSLISETDFTIGCCGSNLNLDVCEVNNSSFSDYNNWHRVNINNSTLLNTPFNLESGHLSITNSVIEYHNSDATNIIAETVELENNTLKGNSSIDALLIYGNNGINNKKSKIENNTFENYKNAVKVNDFSSFVFTGNSFVNTQNIVLENNSSKNINARENYWGSADENVINAKIIDGNDDLNYGFVDYSNFLLSPIGSECPDDPIALSFSAANVCSDGTFSISYEGDSGTTDWNFNDASVISGSGYGPYVLEWNTAGEKIINVTITYSAVCTVDSTIVVNVSPSPSLPVICQVSYDSESEGNMISWTLEGGNIDFYEIYRESSSASEFSLLGTVNSDIASFIDETSNPAQQAYGYKIRSADTCGIYSDYSTIHKSIHLLLNPGINESWNLFWDGYIGIDVDSYVILRRTENSDWEEIKKISGNFNSYTDFEVPQGNVEYQIAFEHDNCNPSSRIAEGTIAYSNIVVRPGVEEVEETVLGIDRISLEIFPNPVVNTLFIESDAGEKINYSIISIGGKELVSGSFSEKDEIEISHLEQGVYFIRFVSSTGYSVRKVIKN